MNKKRQKAAFDIHRTLPNKPLRANYDDQDLEGEWLEKPKKHLWKKLLVSLILLGLAVVITIGVWDAFNISRASQKAFGSGNLLSLLTAESLKTQNDRVNVLLVGYSVDDPGHPGSTLTDSIMILSLSTTNHSGYMLSIPRDLYVKIPGFGYAKINEAYQDGGLPLLEQVISADFNTPIDYYALSNYAAIRETVNALGGITVNIQSPDPRGLYDPNISPIDGGPLKLPNGLQIVDGQTALNLTRARGDAYGSYGFPQADFNRTEHQRQVILAIKSKLNWKLILNPLQNGKIFSALGDNIKTDLSLGETRPLFGVFNSTGLSNLKSYSLNNINGRNYLTSYGTPTGQSALIPSAGISDYSEIQAAIQAINQ